MIGAKSLVLLALTCGPPSGEAAAPAQFPTQQEQATESALTPLTAVDTSNAPAPVSSAKALPEPPKRKPAVRPLPSPSPAPLPAGPSLAQCQRAATARAQVAPARARRWLADARRSAALPDLDATWERRLGNGWRLDREVGTPDQLVDDHDAADVWRIKLSWQLDRAWFNPDELRAARAAADLERLRRELMLQVTQLYFDRARAWTAVRDSSDPVEAAQARLAAQEVDGLLSSITGLSFPAHPWQAPPQPPGI